MPKMLPALPTALRAFITPIVFAIFVAACAAPARVDQMTAAGQPVPAAAVPEALRQNIAIKEVTGGQDTNPLWVSQVSSSEFERALEASLRSANLLQPNRQAGRYMLAAYLAKLDQPLIGFSMTVTATVTYTLIERSTNKTIWEKTLATPYTAGFGDSLLGVERLRLANEGAIRTNISALVEELTRIRTG